MIVAVITVHSAEQAWGQMLLASGCEGIELRLDFWPEIDYAALRALRQKSPLPLIFTLRDVSNGGQYTAGEAQRLLALKKIAEICQHKRSIERLLSSSDDDQQPDYIDIEHSVPVAFLCELKKEFPAIRIVRSYHDFISTPKNLDELLDALIYPMVSAYKIVTMASSVLDGLRMLSLVKKRSKKLILTGMCLGEIAEFTRVLSSVFGGAWVYAPLDDESSVVAGQLSVQALKKIYHLNYLNKNTAIYGVIGNPVQHSVGPFFHNSQFKDSDYNAVYVKLKCKPEELEDFFCLIKGLNFKGLSITTPLKPLLGSFAEYADEVTKNTQCVNTLSITDESVYAFNTDGTGALAALHKHIIVKNKKILVIGAGSTAKAIIYVFSQAGAHVTVINRTEKKSLVIAQNTHSNYLMLETLRKQRHQFEVVINTVPNILESQDFINDITSHCLNDKTFAMDCTYNPQETLFIKAAKRVGSSIVYGKELFHEQALRQQRIWKNAQIQELVL